MIKIKKTVSFLKGTSVDIMSKCFHFFQIKPQNEVLTQTLADGHFEGHKPSNPFCG